MSIVGLHEQMPPMTNFVTEVMEDRDATIEKKEFVGKEVDFIHVFPAGCKDRFEFEWESWKRQTQRDVQEGRFPREWMQMITAKYNAFKAGTPMPSFGTPIQGWKHASPNDVAACKSQRITTIEELASANEDTLRRLGMNARILQRKAQMFVDQQPIPTSELIKKQLLEDPSEQRAMEDLHSRDRATLKDGKGVDLGDLDEDEEEEIKPKVATTAKTN